MTYEEILKELDEVGLKEKFTSSFEGFLNNELLEWVKTTDKIRSTGSLIVSLLKFYDNETEECLYWRKVLFYFMTPKFARDNNQLPNEK